MEGVLAVFIAFLVALGNAIPFEYQDHDPDCPYPDTGMAVYYPYPYDCSKFYECAQGKKVLKDCPPGLLWDVRYNTCNNDYAVDCSQVVSSSVPPSPTTEPQTRPTEPPTIPTSRPTEPPSPMTSPTTMRPTNPTGASTIDPSGLCENQPNGTYLPYPGDKKRYIECNFHHTIVYTCPGNTFWDQSYLNCV